MRNLIQGLHHLALWQPLKYLKKQREQKDENYPQRNRVLSSHHFLGHIHIYPAVLFLWGTLANTVDTTGDRCIPKIHVQLEPQSWDLICRGD